MSWYPICECGHGYTSHADWMDCGGNDWGDVIDPPAFWPDGEPISEGQCFRCLCRHFVWDGKDGDKVPGIMFQIANL